MTPLPTAASNRFRTPRPLETIGERFRAIPFGSGARRWLKRAYHAALMAQTGGRGLRAELPGGELVRVLPEHRYLSWNQEEYEAFRAASRAGMIALDVGANVGAYSMLLGAWTGASGTVFAFEPAPRNYAGLARHVQLNHLDAIVRPVASAIGEAPSAGALILANTTGESRLATGGPAEAVGATVAVDVTSIDAFCARERVAPDFIKIDVEGGELAALRGARETIKARRGSLALFVEMHPTTWPSLGISRGDILAELRAQQLEAVPLARVDDMWATEGRCLRLIPG
jgi:FkbM family methyltransferase